MKNANSTFEAIPKEVETLGTCFPHFKTYPSFVKYLAKNIYEKLHATDKKIVQPWKGFVPKMKSQGISSNRGISFRQSLLYKTY